MRRFLTDLALGTILAAFASGLSCLLAFVGFGRPYYLGIFLPLFMLAYILIAWLLYLRGDRFMGSPSGMRTADARPVVPIPRRDSADPLADAGRSPETLVRVAARWDDEPLRRPDSSSAECTPLNPPFGAGVVFPRGKRALLLAAAELGIAASLLYSHWGIGAVYYS